MKAPTLSSFSACFVTTCVLLLACAPAWAGITHQKVFIQHSNTSATGVTDTFTASASAANDAVVIGAYCANSGDTPTGVTLTAPGWSFTRLGTINGGQYFGVWTAIFGAIAPNTNSTTFTVTWTSASNCIFSELGDEFAGTDTSGGTTTFDATGQNNALSGSCSASVTTKNANDAVWGACWPASPVTSVGSGYTQGGNDGSGNWSEFKVTTDPANTVEAVSFGSQFGIGFSEEAVTIKPGGSLPSVSSLTPNSGAVGSSIVIAGSNFGSTQGNGGVKFSGTAATISSWASTSITAVVPAGATTGNVVVTTGSGASSSGVTFTVVSAPSITSLTPNSGAVGSSIVIAGSNFGSTQGNGGVKFNGTAATISSWSNTSVTAVVPTGANTGNVVVTAAGGVASSGVSFTVVSGPNITSLTPNSGAVGSSIVIAGSNFGSTQGNGGVKFNGTAATISSWSNTSITAMVPTGATTGNVVVTAAGGVASSGVSFTVVSAPSIASLTPNSGAIGSSIVIAGSNFGSTQGNGGVKFNGTAATISSWSNTSVTAVAPTGATTGNVVVTTAGGVASSGVSFTVVSAPSITSISPTSGAVGTSVTITGTNFGVSQGNGGVMFDGTAATIGSWSNTSIGVTVPTGATTGNVVVTAAGGVASNGVAFTVAATPTISSLTPNSGAVGSAIVIAGSNFGTTQGTVTFNRTTATVSSWGASSITATVPTGATTGNVAVTAGGVASNGVNFTVVPAPNITSASPASGAVGSSVTITGTNFGATQGNGGVTFNGTAATISSWSNTSITAVAPTGATTGNVLVTAAGGVASNGVSFTVTPPPSISALTPNSGAVGSAIVISGANFGSSVGTVTFNGAAATTSSWSSTSVTVTVPSGATTGNVVVTAVGVVASNGVVFTLESAPTITSISPGSGPIGISVTIAGANFGSAQGNGGVTFNGTPATVGSWSNGSIVVAVPNGATTGSVVVTAAGGVASSGDNFTVTPPYSFSLSYAPDSEILTSTDSVNGDLTYTYDDFNRLATANNTAPRQGFSYSYDQYANRWQQNLTAGTGGTSSFTFSSASTATTNGPCYHAAGLTNQPDGYCYDAAGNLFNDGVHTYAYDAENRLIAVDPVPGGGDCAPPAPPGNACTPPGTIIPQYVYDGGGRRVHGPNGEYIYDQGGRMITQVDSNGNLIDGEVYALNRHILTYSGSTATNFFGADWLGTKRVMIGLNGAVSETCSGLPFGDGTNCVGTNWSIDDFTDDVHDPESNLEHTQARQYSSAMGRWTGADSWLGSTDVTNPQSLNRYAYVGNDPANMIDPSGLAKVCMLNNNGDETNVCVTGNGFDDPPNLATGGSFGDDSFLTYVPGVGFVFASSGFSMQIGGLGGDGLPGTCETDTCVGGQLTFSGLGSLLGQLPGSNCTGPISDQCGLGNGLTNPPEPFIFTQGVSDLLQNLFTTAAALIHNVAWCHSLWPGPNCTGGNRLFGTRWCGPGGGGPPNPNEPADAPCMAHDICYDNAGLSADDNTNPNLSASQGALLQACNQKLCDAESSVNDAASRAIISFFTNHPLPQYACH